MNPYLLGALAGVLTALIAGAVTLIVNRTTSPQNQSLIGATYSELLENLRLRIADLELNQARLNELIARYVAHFGALPLEVEIVNLNEPTERNSP